MTKIKFFLSYSVVAGLLSCSSSTKEYGGSSQSIKIPAGFTPATAEVLTLSGDNGESYFSPDGTRLIFQSKDRSEHKNSQIYIYDFGTKKEKRITFNDGDDTCGYFSPDGKRIIYASTTDEIKEHPEPPTPPTAAAPGKKYEWKFLNYEIYSANPDGSKISRLTKSKGYDAEGVFSYTGRSIIFTSKRDGDLELYTMTSDGRNQRRLTYKKGYDGGAFYSPDSKSIVWRGFHDDKGNGHLYVSDTNAKNIKQLTTKDAIHWCPFWTPDGKRIIFSSNRDDARNFELYVINADGTCLKRLTYSAGADILPSLSPDGKKISFTSNRSGSNQIYVMDFVEPKDCSSEKP